MQVSEVMVKAFSERMIGIRKQLLTEAPHIFNEQKHCELGTSERYYWHHGYMMALQDIIRQLGPQEVSGE